MIDSQKETLNDSTLVERLFRHLDLQGDDNPVAQLARFHWERVLAIADGAPQPPVAWEINPSGRCNLHCRFCLYPNADNVFIDFDHYRRLVDEAVVMGANAIIMAGDGEPLLHKQCTEMMEHVESSGLDLHLFTNGTMIGRSVDPAVVVATTKMIIWGLYAHDPGSYEVVTKSKLFDRAEEALVSVQQARDVMDGPGPAIIGGWVGDGCNTNHAALVADYGRYLNFDRLFMRSDVTGDGFESSADVEALYAALIRLRQRLNNADPNYVQVRMLFDRKLGYSIDDHDGAIALLHPDSPAWPINERWLTWNDIMYVGPNGDIRVSNRNEIKSGSNRPFVVGSTRSQSIANVLTTGQTSDLIATGDIPVGQVVGRKAISNILYNLVARCDNSSREELRSAILARYPTTQLTTALRNYF